MNKDTMPKENTILKRSEQLKKEKTLQNLYNIIFENKDAVASYFLKNDEERTYTNQDYLNLIDNYAAFLQHHIGKENQGRFVAIALDTFPEWTAVFWATLKSGYNVLLLNFAAPTNITQNLIAESNAVAIIADKPKETNIKEIMLSDLMNHQSENESFEPHFGEYVALCTSGTTGQSRIFVYDGNAICNQVLSSELLHERCKRIVDVLPRRVLAFLPYHHVFGFLTGVLWIPFIGYSNVFLTDRSPNTVLSTCTRFKVNLVITVPILANNICVGLEKKLKQSRLKSVMFYALKGISLFTQRLFPQFGIALAKKVLFKSVLKKLLGTDIDCIILGGSHTPREHLATLSALGYYTVCGFGMTETAINSVETSMSLRKRLLGSVGMPLSNIDYRIIPTNDKSNVGEMLIAGETLHIGILKNGEITAPERINGKWFPTGDIVKINHDKRVFVVGRCKDLIINESGENVYPDEIEDYFSKLTGIEQFSVIGVKKDKHTPYEDICLVLNVGSQYTNNTFLTTLQDSILHINASLNAIKRITRIIVTPSPLPLVNGIKVKRLELKSNIENNKIAYKDILLKAKKIEQPKEEKIIVSTMPSSLEIDEIKGKLLKIYSEVLEVPADQLKLDAHFIDDLGGDSLQILSIALKTEETFNVNIPVEQYPQCTTINDMASLLYGIIHGNVAYENTNTTNTDPVTPITSFEDTPEFQAFQARREALLKNEVANPYFVVHDSVLRDTSLMDGKEILNFGSYNYVGMSGREEVNAAALKALQKYGTSASGSRLLAGEKQIHRDLEKTIAEFKHTEDAVVLVGGHSTNVTFVGNFCGPKDLIVYDALAHNSIEQGCRLSEATTKPFPHNDAQALEQLLTLHRHKYEKCLIIIEGAYSMDGDIADVPAFIEVKNKFGCFLMVDEAHSACVIGEHGGGVDEYFGLKGDEIDIKMGTLSKGIGTCGGYLAGSKNLIEYLRYSLPGFVFSVGLSPVLAAAAQEAILQLKKNPSIIQNLHNNIKCFVETAKSYNYNICLAGETAIIPIMVGSEENAFILSKALEQHGVFVPPAVYPAVPKNKARLRFCVISEHKPEQIKYALETLNTLANSLNIDLPRTKH